MNENKSDQQVCPEIGRLVAKAVHPRYAIWNPPLRHERRSIPEQGKQELQQAEERNEHERVRVPTKKSTYVAVIGAE
jgi:hypothetical protein